jgi:hypothetical protein
VAARLVDIGYLLDLMENEVHNDGTPEFRNL